MRVVKTIELEGWDMIAITFRALPINQDGIWRVHIGHPNQPFTNHKTKRDAEECLAILGREATALLRQINETFRRISLEGQSMVFCLKQWDIHKWNEHKAQIDDLIWWVASHQKTLTPLIFRRMLQAANSLVAMCNLICSEPKIKYTGISVAMAMLTNQATALVAEVDQVWAAPPGAAQLDASPRKVKPNKKAG